MKKKRTSDGKFLSLFEVFEPGANEAVQVAVIFEDIGHRGLVDTSFVDLYGTWKETSNIANAPIFQLERLKISEMKRHFGFEYMVNEVRPCFDYFPNSYHAFWSIRPQITRESEETSLTGGGELIVIRPFSGFAREGSV